MKLSQLGEFGLIRRIAKGLPASSQRVAAGIGDDAAALLFGPSSVVLAAADMLLEGVHFDLSYTDFFSLGWKAAAANLSDIAAMGGVPRFCLTAIAVPSDISSGDILDFYRGFERLILRHHAELVGGDTCISKNGVVVSVTMLGEVHKKGFVQRSGARPGHSIFVTGTLGDSAAGLEILRRGRRDDIPGAVRLIGRHLRPEPRVEWGRKIAGCGCASSMIDISDGLSSDLAHICGESGVGAELYLEQIPVSRPLTRFSMLSGRPAVDYALSGGEDYELLFTVPEPKARSIPNHIPAVEIGRITDSGKIFITDESGRRRLLVPSGYDHFASRSGRTRRNI